MELSFNEWKVFIANHPEAHILQTGEWGELKSAFGWEAVRVVSGEVGAQILFLRLPLGFTLAYMPKGPVVDDGRQTKHDGRWSVDNGLWSEIDRACSARHAVFLKIEPDAWDTDDWSLITGHWSLITSPYNIQPPRTVIVNLRGSEDEILARMKQKCRYNIRLAEKKGVIVRPWDDLEAFHRMLLITGERDVFGVHSLAYYRRAYELFHPAGMCELLVAEHADKPLAALMAFASGKCAWYFYGASTDEERNRMPTYLLQWEAMRWAKERGCENYDLWGVPDEDEATLEGHFTTRSDGLWGVYRFKRGFGGELKRAAQAMDRVYNPLLYRLYLWRMAGREGM